MSELLVNTIKKADGTGSLTVPAESGTVVTTASPSLGRRNLIINGAMQVAQRGTSSTTYGYNSVDRFKAEYAGGTVTYSQASSNSSDSPYTEGFRKYFRATNTTAGSTPTTDFAYFTYYVESQDIANSGWNHKSASSYITLSFWARSSLTGTYYVTLTNQDGTKYSYPASFDLTADTWEKQTITVSGNSNLVFNDDNGQGLEIIIRPYTGTDYTASSKTANAWSVKSSSAQTPDFAQNWRASAGATFDITGVQLEVGSVVTPFEHRSYGEELALCQRYYYKPTDITANGNGMLGTPYKSDDSLRLVQVKFPVTMRSTPSLTVTASNTVDTNQIAPHGSDTLMSSVNTTFGAFLTAYEADAEL